MASPWSFLFKPASPEALALGGLWSGLLDLGLAAVLLAGAVNAWAPPQDLPWKPLDLTRPAGLATGVQLARAAGDRALCRRALGGAGVRLAEEPARRSGDCATPNAVRLQAGMTRLSPAAPVMSCPVALAYVAWVRHVVQPAAREGLGSPVRRVDHFGTYACRNVYGRADGRRSQHATANALDVASFVLADGREVSVASHFRATDTRGAFLRTVRDGACRYFRATLSPDYNAAHRDHLHLDFGGYRACR